MSKTIVIVHFQPLELYPPVMNLLNFITNRLPQQSIIVYTTHCSTGANQYISNSANCRIVRLGKLSGTMHSLKRYFNYAHFNVGVFVRLLLNKPAAVFYYETLSSYPVYLYKQFVDRSLPVFIHYHEYTSPPEYRSGMKLVSFFHKREKNIYPQAEWISHTNKERMRLFLMDEGLSTLTNTFVLPNYPSIAWQSPPKTIAQPVRLVYVGALGLDTMYTASFAHWVISAKGQLIWDIYTNNASAEAIKFIEELNSPYINIRGSLPYHGLAQLLPSYHVGVILYNGHISNYVINAPNKLFEYLACGLDVWFPEKMTGCREYITHKTYPAVVALDFLHLQDISIIDLISRKDFQLKRPEYFYEEVYPAIMSKLVSFAQ